MSEAILFDAIMMNADLSGANLHQADLRGAFLAGANLNQADLEAADLTKINMEQRESGNGLLGPPTKFTTLRSVEPFRLRRQRTYLLQKTASFLSVSSQLFHRINSGNYTTLPLW